LKPWAIAEALSSRTRRGPRKPLDLQATATETGLDIDVRGSVPSRRQEQQSLRASPSGMRWRGSRVMAKSSHNAWRRR
jgi:hypothetical protein